MGYSIMHIEKIKSYSKIGKAYEHNYRIATVPNAIPDQKTKNEELIHRKYNTDEQMTYLDEWKKRLYSLPAYAKGKHKIRSNAILALEVVMTFSRENRIHINLEQWKEENLKWLQKNFNISPEKYGDNILSVMCHEDEVGNIHCHAIIQPIDDKGHLNASFYIDGREKGKSRYTILQDSYAEQMKQFGLERGMKGSKAKHKDIKKFYTELNHAIGSVPKPKKGELATEYYQRFQNNLNSLEAFYIERVLKRQRSAEEWITNKLNSINNEIQEERDRLKQEQEKSINKMQQELSTYITRIAEAEQKYIDINRLINDTTITFNTLISQKQQDYNILYDHMIDIQDMVMSYENKYDSMSAAEFLSHLQKGTLEYTTLHSIDPEAADLMSRIAQDMSQNIVQQQEWDATRDM